VQPHTPSNYQTKIINNRKIKKTLKLHNFVVGKTKRKKIPHYFSTRDSEQVKTKRWFFVYEKSKQRKT